MQHCTSEKTESSAPNSHRRSINRYWFIIVIIGLLPYHHRSFACLLAGPLQWVTRSDYAPGHTGPPLAIFRCQTGRAWMIQIETACCSPGFSDDAEEPHRCCIGRSVSSFLFALNVLRLQCLTIRMAAGECVPVVIIVNFSLRFSPLFCN